jgi:hypothetical protein
VGDGRFLVMVHASKDTNEAERMTSFACALQGLRSLCATHTAE